MEPLRRKNLIYSIVLILLMGVIYLYRSQQNTPKNFHVSGVTMGVVPYNVKYIDEEGEAYQVAIDKLLQDFNQSLSTYVPSSEISRFNQGEEFTYESNLFYPVLAKSQEVYEKTQGAFDPTIMPLVSAWGFGPNKKERRAESMPAPTVDSLLQLVGFSKVIFDKQKVKKQQSGVELDFGAIAKGYAVDLVADFLDKKQVKHYMVEIGGEVVCKGKNPKDKIWTIGINNPKDAEQGVNTSSSAIIQLDNKAMATSGNYRNFYIKEGKKYAHTIDPQSGYPVEHSLLSASVFAPDCMTADAYATAFMVMGTEKAIAILKKEQTLDALLIYEEEGVLKTYQTTGVKNMLVE